MEVNIFTTLLDLTRQSKILSGETATFDGKIEVGIPFSGYSSGVDTSTIFSLGVVSSESAIFSGDSGTTIFDVSNTGSTNYDPIFSGFSGDVWTNSLFSGNTSGLTLPITPFSAETQIVGPFWTLTQTGMTGDYIIGIEYTGYSITYSFTNISNIGTGTTYSGLTIATQENFSAGTLDYKGPLDYISSKEDGTIEGRLTTNKFTMTNGASSSTIGYVLTQVGENGESEWKINSSAGTNTYVTGGTLNGSNELVLEWNTGGSASPISLNNILYTGNTSGDCISDLWVSNIHSCSPLFINPNNEGNVYFGSTSGITFDISNERIGISTQSPTESLHVKGDYLIEETDGILFTDLNDGAGAVLTLSGTSKLLRHQMSVGTGGVGTGAGGSIGIRSWDDFTYTAYGKPGDMHIYAGISSNGLNIISTDGLGGAEDYIRFYAGRSANTGGDADIHIQGTGSTKGYVGIATESPTNTLHVNGSFRLENGTEQSNYVLTSNSLGVGTWQPISGLTTGLTLSEVLSNGNTTGSNWIDVQTNFGLRNLQGGLIERTYSFDSDGLIMETTDGTNSGEISLGNDGIFQVRNTNQIFFDQYYAPSGTTFKVRGSNAGGFEGIQYDDDYSANYINRSLVDKEYVDNSITGYTGNTLSQVLSNGNITGGNDIIITSGDNVISSLNDTNGLFFPSSGVTRLQSTDTPGGGFPTNEAFINLNGNAGIVEFEATNLFDVNVDRAQFSGQIKVGSKTGNTVTTGNTFTYDCDLGMTQKLDLQGATTGATITFSNQQEGSTYTLIVVQGSGTYDLTFPSGWWLNDTAPFDFTTLADNDRVMVTSTYLDSEWYFAVKQLTFV